MSSLSRKKTVKMEIDFSMIYFQQLPLNQKYLSNPSHKEEKEKLKNPISLALMTLLGESVLPTLPIFNCQPNVSL